MIAAGPVGQATVHVGDVQCETVQPPGGHVTSQSIEPPQSTVACAVALASTLQSSPGAHVTSQVSPGAHWMWQPVPSFGEQVCWHASPAAHTQSSPLQTSLLLVHAARQQNSKTSLMSELLDERPRRLPVIRHGGADTDLAPTSRGKIAR